MIKTISKVDAMIKEIAKSIFITKVGDRIKTVKELAEEYSMSVGTVQKAFDILEQESCYELENKGVLGKILISKNINRLLKIAEINEMLAVMPLPKTKRYEGLATALKKVFLDKGIRLHFAYMQGSIIRLNMVKDGIYDFAIVSDLAYRNNKNKFLKKVISLGEKSYVKDHVLISKDKINKIGIDENSEDQYFLTKEFIKNKNYELVDINTDAISNLFLTNEIDAAICSIDEIEENNLVEFNIKKIDIPGKDYANEADIIINSDDKVIYTLIKELIDINEIIEIQKKVINKEIIPRY